MEAGQTWLITLNPSYSKWVYTGGDEAIMQHVRAVGQLVPCCEEDGENSLLFIIYFYVKVALQGWYLVMTSEFTVCVFIVWLPAVKT